MANYFVYVLTNKPRGTLYVGVTNDLVRRIFEHREGSAHGFTQRYGLKQLVYFEIYDDPTRAIQREKNIKHWPREWKIELVQNSNPQCAMNIRISRVEVPDGCPGQARA